MGRALRWLLFAFLLFNSPALAQVPSTGQFFTSNCSSLANPVANSTYCVQTTTTGGRTAGHQYRWNGSSWDDITATSGITGVPTSDCSNTLTGKVIWNNSTKAFSCATDQTVAGAIASLNGLTATTQTFANDTNVTITSAGSTHTLGWSGALAKARQNIQTVYLDQSNTFTSGVQNFSAIATGGGGVVMPSTAGYAPTTAALFGFNSSTLHFVGGNGTVTKTFSFSDEIQPINANLTAFSALIGSNSAFPVFSGPGNLALSVINTCADAGGQHLNYDATTHTFSCGSSSGTALSGLTAGKYLIATGSTAADTSGALSETGGVVNAANGFTNGNVGTDSLDFITTAYTGHAHNNITIPYVGGAASVALSTGTLTPTHTIVVGANGQLIDSGSTGGTGTWTDSSTNTANNKTIVDQLAQAGTGNTLTTAIRASFDGGSLTPDGTNCTDPTKQTIGASGPTQYAFVCPTPTSAVFDAVIINLKNALTTFKVILKVNEPTTNGHVFAGTFKAQCHASGTAPSSTWGTTVSVSITMTTAGNTYGNALSGAITPAGTCSAGADLYIRFNGTGSMTDTGTARVLGLYVEQAS